MATPVRFTNDMQYPLAEAMLDQSKIQPYIHDCVITVHEGAYIYKYRIFFKRHCFLSLNPTITQNSNSEVAPFRGDILVMRVSTKNSFCVNFRERDTILADFLVKE